MLISFLKKFYLISHLFVRSYICWCVVRYLHQKFYIYSTAYQRVQFNITWINIWMCFRKLKPNLQ